MKSFKPHPYQQRGIDWIIQHPSSGLFLPMGAGKTITTLSALDQLKYERFEIWKTLIIGPKRVIETTWPDEIAKWENINHLSYSVISGTPKQREQALAAKADIYLIGKENVQWLVETIGMNWPFDCLVIDELSTFKNSQAKRFKALKTVMPFIKHFVGLTGTPTPKGIPDLWAQIYLMDKGERLGKTITSFRQTYLTPGMSNGYQVYQWRVRPGADKIIQEKISDICMSLDQKEYATLPDVSFLDFKVDLKKDLEKYKVFKREMLLELENDDAIIADNAGAMCGKLLQYTSGAIYDEDHNVHELHSYKLEALNDLMESANGEPVLIFYWHQHERERIVKALKDYNGMTIDQKGSIQKWNAGQLDYLLLQPASAGHGLNLQDGGHLAIWYSLPNWNLELYQQANARIFRQGQKQKVTIYHLLAKGTIDEDMLVALENKEKVQDAMLKALRR